jgi:hypothetical protein
MMRAMNSAVFEPFLNLIVIGLTLISPMMLQAQDLPACNAQNTGNASAWFLTKTEWSAADEKEWQEWIVALYKSSCHTLGECLKSPANKFRKSDPPNMNMFSDCTDFPYKLRMYFSWKKGLPFSYLSDVSARPLSAVQIKQRLAEGKPEVQTDSRSTINGNQPEERRNLPSNSGYSDFVPEFGRIGDLVSTATLRLNPVLFGNAPLRPDFYAVKMGASEIKTGTVAYDASGHVAIVIRTYPDGRIDFFDSKSDGSVGRPKFPAFRYFKTFSRADHGVIFQNWRPIKVGGAMPEVYNGICHYYSISESGGIALAPDRSIRGQSYEQAVGTEWKPGQPIPSPRDRSFKINGSRVESHLRFMQLRLAKGQFRVDPVQTMNDSVGELCAAIEHRVTQVKGTLEGDAPIFRQSFLGTGDRLFNVYGGEGAWFKYSTPSADVGIRKVALELVSNSKSFLKRLAAGDPEIAYSGTDLKTDLVNAYVRVAKACVIRYQRSDGGLSRQISLPELLMRSTRFSFNPYDCPERRWGASDPAELRLCTNDASKEYWYKAMQPLRNAIEKDETANMAFTLPEIEADPSLLGPIQEPVLDIENRLRAL